jgi:hypothetical protein
MAMISSGELRALNRFPARAQRGMLGFAQQVGTMRKMHL